MGCTENDTISENTKGASLVTPSSDQNQLRTSDSGEAQSRTQDVSKLSQAAQSCCDGLTPAQYNKLLQRPVGNAESFLPSFATFNGGVKETEPGLRPAETQVAQVAQPGRTTDSSATAPVTVTDANNNEVTTFKNDPQHRVKETRFYDGKHQQQHETEFAGRPDGIVKEVGYLNKTERNHKDGTKTTDYVPGDGRNPDNFVRQVTENAHRTTTKYENHPDNISSVTDYRNQPSGLVKATHYEDKSSRFEYKDGRVKTRSATGEESVTNPKAEAAAEAASKPTTQTFRDADNNKITEIKNDPQKRVKVTEFNDGKHEARTETQYEGRADGLVSEREYLNRTEKTYSTGSKLTEYVFGDRRNPEPLIKSMWEAKNHTTRTYENHPEKIAEVTDLKNHPSGLQQRIKYTDQTVESRFKDGTVVTRTPDGAEIVRKPKR